jgi:hypothetical protein
MMMSPQLRTNKKHERGGSNTHIAPSSPASTDDRLLILKNKSHSERGAQHSMQHWKQAHVVVIQEGSQERGKEDTISQASMRVPELKQLDASTDQFDGISSFGDGLFYIDEYRSTESLTLPVLPFACSGVSGDEDSGVVVVAPTSVNAACRQQQKALRNANKGAWVSLNVKHSVAGRVFKTAGKAIIRRRSCRDGGRCRDGTLHLSAPTELEDPEARALDVEEGNSAAHLAKQISESMLRVDMGSVSLDKGDHGLSLALQQTRLRNSPKGLDRRNTYSDTSSRSIKTI